MGLCLPLSKLGGSVDGFHLRVMTVNCGGVNWKSLVKLIEAEQPDIIAFQEFGNVSDILLGGKWYWHHGSGTAIASRFPIISDDAFPASRLGRWGDAAVSTVVELPTGNAKIYSLHLNTARWGLEELRVSRRGVSGIYALEKNTREREFESKAISSWIGTPGLPTIVAGDFNMPAESMIYRRYWSNYQNAFAAAGWGYGHSKFARWLGVRIDHVLADAHWHISDCHVAGPDGGDHQPVVAELILRSAS